MEDLIIEILSIFNYPIIRQGSMPENEQYPDHFFTFWNRNSDSDDFLDNDEHSIEYEYDLNFYSIDPGKTYEMLIKAKSLLKSHDFICSGEGHDVASDEATHTGRGISILYNRQI